MAAKKDETAKADTKLAEDKETTAEETDENANKSNTDDDETKESVKPDPVSPWDVMVEVKLPKASKTEQNFQFVAVNGRTFQVPKGKRVKVPKPIAEVLQNSEKAIDDAEAFENSILND